MSDAQKQQLELERNHRDNTPTDGAKSHTRRMIDAENLTTFLVVGNDFTWGKGKSIPEARKNAKRQGGGRGVKYFAYATSDDVTVHPSGSLEATALFRIGAL